MEWGNLEKPQGQERNVGVKMPKYVKESVKRHKRCVQESTAELQFLEARGLLDGHREQVVADYDKHQSALRSIQAEYGELEQPLSEGSSTEAKGAAILPKPPLSKRILRFLHLR